MKKLEHDLITNDNTFIEYYEESIKYNAPHDYEIKSNDGNVLCKIHFQTGPVKEKTLNGIFNEDLIAIVINRLEAFQTSEFKCNENAEAIKKLEESLMWLRKRTNRRKAKGIIGTSQKG